MHNGTIHNYEELAKKYIPDINISGMTDSQVMARVFFYSGYSALEEYNGSAVFVIVDYRKEYPKTLFFKGSSRRTQYSTATEEERPLYYCLNKARKELVFSSIWPYLAAVRKELEVYSLDPNILFEFTGSTLTKLKEYNRDKCFQSRKSTFVTFPINWENNFIYDNYISINNQSNTYSYKGEKIYGKVFLTLYGKVEQTASKKATEVFFFDGVAMKNSKCFEFLSSLLKESKLTKKAFSEKFKNVIRFLSIDEVYCYKGVWRKAISPLDSVLFTGELQALTSTMRSKYEKGILKFTVYGKKFELINLPEKTDINFKIVREQCKLLMK